MNIIQRAVERVAGPTVPSPGATPLSSAKASPAGAPPRRSSRTVTLDLDQLARAGLIVRPETRTTVSEQFRHIKMPLLWKIAKANPLERRRQSLIMVTSALPGEGKTFCAINLALSMAMEVDRHVLLVDGDVVRCGLTSRLGLGTGPGLLDVLNDRGVDLASVLLRTNIPQLSVLPGGTRTWRSTELLGSEAMDELLAELSGRYPDRVIVFDSTPLLVASEAKTMAPRMGQVIVVVDAENTPREAVEAAFDALSDCPDVMSVLNKGREPQADYGLYYG